MTTELHRPDASPELADALDGLIVAVRAEIDAAHLLEHRAAALGALLARSGPRYLDVATRELEEAFGVLQDASSTRRFAVRRAGSKLGLSEEATLSDFASGAPFPYGSALASLGGELVRTHKRVAALTESNTTALGQRLALVNEALRGVGDDAHSTYGRVARAPARIVRGLL